MVSGDGGCTTAGTIMVSAGWCIEAICCRHHTHDLPSVSEHVHTQSWDLEFQLYMDVYPHSTLESYLYYPPLYYVFFFPVGLPSQNMFAFFC